MTDTEIPDTVVEEALTAEELAYLNNKGETPAEPKPEPEVKAEAEPKVEEPAAEEKTEEKEPEVVNLVPQGALQEERARRKKLEARLALLEQRASQEVETKGEPKAPGLDEIDETKNPLEAIAALKAEIQAKKQAEVQMQQQRAEMERVSAIGTKHAERFAKQQPHFFDGKDESGNPVQGAYTFMRSKAAETLQAQYPQATQAEILEAVNAVERRHIEECVKNGENAAEKLWELAVEQGYKAPVKAAPKTETQRNDKGQFTAEKVAELEKAQKSSKSLGSVPAGGESVLTLEALADMDEDEFAAATQGNKWEKMHRSGVI